MMSASYCEILRIKGTEEEQIKALGEFVCCAKNKTGGATSITLNVVYIDLSYVNAPLTEGVAGGIN